MGVALRLKRFGILAALLLVGVVFAWRWWQGPVVSVVSVQQAPLVQTVVASGRVTNEARLTVGTEVVGEVVTRHVQEGDRVEAGDLLLTLRGDALNAQIRQLRVAQADLVSRQRPQAEAELARAQIELSQAERELQRRSELLESSIITQEAYEQAQRLRNLAEINVRNARTNVAALAENGTEQQRLEAELDALQAQLRKTEIRAPASGIILTRSIETGDIAQPGQTLFTVALDSALEVRSQLDERNLAQLAVGQQAQIIADAYPQRPLRAEVSYIAPTIDPQRGTIEVRLQVQAPEPFLRQDMTVSVNIETAARPNTLVLPNDSLFQQNSNRANVWTVVNNRIEARSVELGLRGLTATEVLSDLKEGALVVVDLPTSITEGDRVRTQLVLETSPP